MSPAVGCHFARAASRSRSWPTRQIAGGASTLREGELLIVIDGPATYGDMVPLMTQLARACIWRFGFVAKQDASTYVKLPTNLPFDRGI